MGKGKGVHRHVGKSEREGDPKKGYVSRARVGRPGRHKPHLFEMSPLSLGVLLKPRRAERHCQLVSGSLQVNAWLV